MESYFWHVVCRNCGVDLRFLVSVDDLGRTGYVKCHTCSAQTETTIGVSPVEAGPVVVLGDFSAVPRVVALAIKGMAQELKDNPRIKALANVIRTHGYVLNIIADAIEVPPVVTPRLDPGAVEPDTLSAADKDFLGALGIEL